MQVDLDRADIDTLLESVEYSLLAVRGQPETPPEVKKLQEGKLEIAKQKLQYAKTQH
jgi:hypothetical protein